ENRGGSPDRIGVVEVWRSPAALSACAVSAPLEELSAPRPPRRSPAFRRPVWVPASVHWSSSWADGSLADLASVCAGARGSCGVAPRPPRLLTAEMSSKQGISRLAAALERELHHELLWPPLL